MLAGGNVTVFNGDHLFIRGDNMDNDIEVASVIERGVDEDGNSTRQVNVQVIGRNGTTVNGSDEPFVIPSAEIENSFFVNGAYDGGLRAHLGQGDDSMLVYSVEFKDSSIVYGGPGDDSIGFWETFLLDDLVVQTFDGDDSVSFQRTSALTEDSKITVITLDGDDTVGFDGGVVQDILVSTGNGDDQVVAFEGFADSSMILTQAGDDFVSVNDTKYDVTRIFTGDGNDNVAIDYRTKDKFDINTDRGQTIVGGQGGQLDSLDVVTDDSEREGIDIRTFEITVGRAQEAKAERVFDELVIASARLATPGEMISLMPSLSTFSGAARFTGLNVVLDGTGFTSAFVPTNAAFSALPDGTLENLTSDQLREILDLHVVTGDFLQTDVLEDVANGIVERDLPFSVRLDSEGELVLNDEVRLQVKEIRTIFGVVHVLDGVLMQ